MALEELQGVHYVSDEETHDQIMTMFHEIKENKQTHGRTDEQLMRNLGTGVSMEIACAKALKGKVNRQVHDPFNPDTFAYDVLVNQSKIEVKPSGKNDVWFNFNLKGETYRIEDLLYRGDLTTFLKYKEHVDLLIVGWSEKVLGGYNVGFKWVILPNSFNNYMSRSGNYQGGKQTTHFYHVKNAIKNEQCIVIN